MGREQDRGDYVPRRAYQAERDAQEAERERARIDAALAERIALALDIVAAALAARRAWLLYHEQGPETAWWGPRQKLNALLDRWEQRP